ncbi:amino acid transporter [Linderina pennispora]|uniref:Amino acid transporter n=1 Tax=Linderina pennispora TaxID=61395 RepID=A0A1Y1WEK9_9FUNG|nr:amino acid transporter [Linderina pennispora]ORX71778.1 amino acid transporter [Linderina pennispora]
MAEVQATGWRHIWNRMTARKPIEQILREGQRTQMNRTLSRLDLIAIGIGAIIGTGIFVLTGIAAAEDAGPAIIVSFIIAGFASGLSAFSYSELASMVPILWLGVHIHFLAWIVGWDLILEYLVGAATVAVGWSAYVQMLFRDAFGVTSKPAITGSPLTWDNKELTFKVVEGKYIDIPAICIILFVSTVLVIGIKQSSWVNKLFIFGGIKYIDRSNYKPFLPPRDGNSFGAKGLFKGAQRVFFAYIGFDAVSTAAQEAKDPQKDLPWGICASLAVCTASVHLDLKGQAAPISFALEAHPNTKWLRILIDIGAVAGLTSVILIMLMSQPRIFFTMARDGLFPRIFGRLHPKFKTPYVPTIGVWHYMTSVGTLLAFILVNIGVIVMRYTHPHMGRGFIVPFGPFVIPIPGAAIALVLLVLSGGPTIYRLFIWLGIGLIVYIAFGYRWSRVGNPDKWSPEDIAYFGDGTMAFDEESLSGHNDKVFDEHHLSQEQVPRF